MVKLSDYDHLSSWKTADKALGNKDSKKIGNNTELVRRASGDIAVELHGHGIIRYIKGSKRVKISSAGYKTSTTKDRLNRYTPSNVNVVQRDGVWYVKKGGKKERFRDGMTV